MEALSWIRNIDFSNVFFEVDEQQVYHATNADVTQFEALLVSEKFLGSFCP